MNTISETITTQHGEVSVERRKRDHRLEITLHFHLDRECLFHWGLSRNPQGDWLLPPEEIRPGKTRPYDNLAAQTPVSRGGTLRIELEDGTYAELPFVLYFPRESEWDNNREKNYRIRLGAGERPSKGISGKGLQDMAAEIIEKETGPNSWTLMHRYNLCHEFLDRVDGDREGLALLFVWLRFSALRQLDWQRNYNTQPRELGHAQQRLTARLARLYNEAPGQRDLVRLMLTTMGHGGEGQRIRDGILEIMHRYGIKEVSEIFMEQWHQKMHNNTTPDDIVICEAYLDFLRSNGNPDAFYRSLEAGGMNRERLESFERPITSRPDFYPDKKEAMIHDFEHFLGVLKAVHSAADLETCIRAARRHFDDDMHQMADFIWDHREDTGAEAIPLLRKVTALRRRMAAWIESEEAMPDLLCLDIALEGFVRTVTERSMQPEPGEEALFAWLALAVENFLPAHPDPDLSFSLLQWNRIRESGFSDPDVILQADSVLDRIERTAGDFAHAYPALLQPKAEFLGKSFGADSWTIRLFSEEVMRGGLIFAFSALTRLLRRRLRKKADLPSWQPVSRGGGKGRVKVVDSLDPVQGARFDPPVIIVSDRVRGEEDIPEGTRALLTSGSVDVVSHVAIRARNQGVLLATCYDAETFERLKSWDGRLMEVSIGASGELRYGPAEESEGPSGSERGAVRPVDMHFTEPRDAPYAVTAEEFEEGLVGGKSLHLKELRGRLPGWIHLPASMALPFATFQKTLNHGANRKIRERYDGLRDRVNEEPDLLQELRRAVMELEAPGGLDDALRERMEKAGLRPPEDREGVWRCIKAVWASRWNERAYWNRKAQGIPHDKLQMAVLVQQMVAADYAFIIHTVHPFSGNREEVYVEVVPGLGETLAGNYPGRALSGTCHKKSGDIRLLAFPSKSIGLYGKGLIFRSDSSAEDLAGYAGAGLYSSFPLEPPREVHLNYTDDPLVQDKEFRREFLSRAGRSGLLIEEVMDYPQDIEGAFAEDCYYVVQTRPQVGLEV